MVDEAEEDDQGSEHDEAGRNHDFGADFIADEADEGREEGTDDEGEEDEGDLGGVVIKEVFSTEGKDGFEAGQDDAFDEVGEDGGEHSGVCQQG